jgi:integrase
MKVTLKERSPGHWRIRIEVGKDGEGKRVFKYETLHGSRDDAERRRFAILTDHEQGTFAVPDKITLGAFFARWIETRFALKKVTRSTVENYRTMFGAYVAPQLGGKRLQAVTSADVQAIYMAMAGSGLSDSTLAHMHRIMVTLYHAARKAKVIKTNIMEEVEAPSRVKPKPKAIGEAESLRLIETLRGDWKEPITILALTAGLRRGEVCGLRWKDIDLTAGKLFVRGQLAQYHDRSVEWVAPKTAKGERAISLPAQTVELLRTLRKEAAATRLKLGLGGGLEDAYVFTWNGDGMSPIKPKQLGQAFSRYCDRHGLPEFTFHGARHTHITELLKRVGKAGAKAVSERAGHANLITTLSIYQTVFESDDALIGARKEK